MNMFTIITKSGGRIENLTMNGSMFVSANEITRDMLTDEALETVTILETPEEGAPTETTLHGAVCDAIHHWPEGWLFNLREPSQQERTIKELQAQNAMLTECVLEMSEIVYGGDL